MSSASFINSRLVGRYGMRILSHGALIGFLTVNALWLVLEILWAGHLPFALFLSLFALAMFQFGWIGSNFNSLAMEPLGHVAGTASSVLGFMGTAGGTVIGAVIGQAFNGTALPMVIGFFTVSVIGLIFVLIAEKESSSSRRTSRPDRTAIANRKGPSALALRAFFMSGGSAPISR